MKKAKRYNGSEGSMTDEDVKSFAGTPENDSNAGMADVAETVAEKPKAKAKAPIVTKEELAKSGLSLRDYMNKQQGLTRRGEKATSTAKASNEDYGNEGKRTASKAARNILEEAKENVRRGNAARASMAEASRPTMEAGRLPKKGPGLSNFKSGGMTASRRADGIATKGKTRGKLC